MAWSTSDYHCIAYGIPLGGAPDTWLKRDGKLYIFGGAGSRDAFLLDVPGNLPLAEKYWREEVAGSNSFIQRSKRLVFRVPHYKSGEELAKMVSDAKAAKPGVNIINRKGKRKRTRGGFGKRADTKRAIVTLREGRIEIFGGPVA